ncbi:MAG: hypothetical protein HY046_02040 [Acidobacteria bacterium]|nr:hypothetical protein [Acidobacteriota bacterium]
MTNLRQGKISLLLAAFVIAAISASACSANCFAAEFKTSAPVAQPAPCHESGMPAPTHDPNSHSHEGKCTHPGHRDTFVKPLAFSDPGLQILESRIPVPVSSYVSTISTNSDSYFEDSIVLPGSAPPLYEKFSLLRI